jgi:hypothetical protein
VQSKDFDIAESSAKGLPQRVPQPQRKLNPQVSQPEPSNSKRPHEAAKTWDQEYLPPNNLSSNPAIANGASTSVNTITQ